MWICYSWKSGMPAASCNANPARAPPSIAPMTPRQEYKRTSLTPLLCSIYSHLLLTLQINGSVLAAQGTPQLIVGTKHSSPSLTYVTRYKKKITYVHLFPGSIPGSLVNSSLMLPSQRRTSPTDLHQTER